MSEPQSSPFDEQRLRRLVELMKEHDLRELELRESELLIRLCRGGPPAAPGAFAALPPQAPAAAVQSPRAAGPREEPEGENIVLIKSPMVGTFFAKPNPKAEPYVRVGDHVDPDTTICMIEAMKVFNEIPAEVRGKIVAILVEDEEPVEFGKPLFKVDTKG